MGQSYSLTTLSAGSAGIDVPELADLAYEKSLGMARFMKSIRAKHSDGLVVVKIAMKPYANMKFEPYVRALLRERKALANVPNALGYERILETGTNGYLARQYLYSSLYDRMSTRPFLEEIEKKWLAFQLLCALRDCHARDVFHGDIKSENVLVTSWNWLYLADFSASFKPAFLPEDNPADFSYYFDTSGRRTCYLAPERFVAAGEEDTATGKVNAAMDIFGAGCVIAELFLEAPTFSLSQLYKYRTGEYDPGAEHLSRIEDRHIRELVCHMLQKKSESRFSAEEYLNKWRRKAFPEYFYSFLHQYMAHITNPMGRKSLSTEAAAIGEADERIERVYHDFDKITYFLGYYNESNSQDIDPTTALYGNGLIPVHINIPNYQHKAAANRTRPADNGTLIFLALIVASLRNSARTISRVHACDLLLAFAERITDDAKIDRILPFAMSLVNDRTDIVKAAAIRTVTQLVALVKVVSPANAYVFPEYILPRFQPIVAGPASNGKPIVRTTYAACIATLANTASRFLDMTQALRADGSLPSVDPETEDGASVESANTFLYDVARNDLVEYFEAHAKSLLTDHDPSVRRAFLGSVSSLCVFFGSTKASDVVLSHLNTYLNDKDWQLKCAFFETIVGVGTFLGSSGLEDFVLPLMVQALTDAEDFVVEKVIQSLASLAELGAFQRPKTWELVDVVGRFAMHPNMWIREAAASFISSATKYLSVADCYCIIGPLVRPFLRYPIANYTELALLDALKKPLPRPVYDMAHSWATKVNKGIFWKPEKPKRTSAFGSTDASLNLTPARDLRDDSLKRAAKNEEDEQWLARLRSIGMTADDELKLMALRGYIWRTAPLRPKEGAGNQAAHLNNVINLKSLNITPQIVFFNDEPRSVGDAGDNEKSAEAKRSAQTISEALAEAATTMNEAQPPEKKNHLQDLDMTPTIRHENSPSPSPSRKKSSKQQATGTSASNGDATGRNTLQVPADGKNGPAASERRSDTTSPATETQGQTMSRKSSAVALMSRTETAKADAETSTTSANAFGELEVEHHRKDVSPARPTNDNNGKANEVTDLRSRAVHTYEGRDPSVLKLLDTVFQENYPSDNVEFGPLVTPISRRQRIKKNSGDTSDQPWRPDGGLVALFGEHTAAVTRIVVAPDHAFFVSASDDGSVKIWDTARLERNIAYRSRQTYRHATGAKVKGLCFVENTHSVVSAATDGSIHVIKVDYIQGTTTSKYGKLRLLKTYQMPADEYAVWLEHFKLDSYSVLMVLTNTSRILAIDLRTMRVLYTLTNPVQHGAPTCFCVDRKRAWLLLGTTHGILSLWDLRFRVRVKAWGLPGGTPTHRLGLYPFKGRGKWVCVAGGCSQGEVSVWDVEKLQCREVFRAAAAPQVRDSPSPPPLPRAAAAAAAAVRNVERQYEAWRIDDEPSDGVLGRFATAALELAPPPGGIDRGMRAFAAGIDSAPAADGGRADARCCFLLTAGADRKIRFWDAGRVEASLVVSGMDLLEEARPSYATLHPTPTLAVHTERVSSAAAAAVEASGPGAGTGVGVGAASPSPSPLPGSPARSPANARPPRSTIISLQQQQLLTAHLDAIVDIALLESPYGMVVSADRSGMIYVFR